ncbi:MAG: hypothetical protein WCL32_19910 [Planctomycetota bacterium]
MMQSIRWVEQEDRVLRPLPKTWEMIDDSMAEIMRQKTPAQRLAIANGMWISARKIITAAVVREHPRMDADAICREVAKRLSRGVV